MNRRYRWLGAPEGNTIAIINMSGLTPDNTIYTHALVLSALALNNLSFCCVYVTKLFINNSIFVVQRGVSSSAAITQAILTCNTGRLNLDVSHVYSVSTICSRKHLTVSGFNIVEVTK